MNQQDRLALNTISNSNPTSEFEIQAELFCRLKDLMAVYRWSVRGGLRARCKDGLKTPKVFFDIVVFDEKGKAFCIIEVKNDGTTGLKSGCRQSRRYSLFKLPIFHCGSLDQISQTIDDLMEAMPALKD